MKFILLAGVNGSGKSTFVKEEPELFKEMHIINPDAIQKNKQLSIFQAGKEAITQAKTFIDLQQSFLIETTLSSQQPLILLKKAKAKGYKTEIVYMIIDGISSSKERIKARVIKGGHDIPEDALNRRYERSFNNLIKASFYADVIHIYDNSKNKRRKILSITDRTLSLYDEVPTYLNNILSKLNI